MFSKYAEFLNFFDPAISIQITINNKNIDKKNFKSKIFIQPKGDALDEYRYEYNNILDKRTNEGRNDIMKEKYITLSLEAKSIDEARASFSKLESSVLNNLKKIGSQGRILETEERLKILHDIYRIGNEENFFFSLNTLNKQGVTAKDVIAPESFTFKRNYMMIGDKYARALCVHNLPTYLTDTFLSEITDVSFNMITTINIKNIPQAKALRLVNKQLTGMKANKIEKQKTAIRSGYDPNIIQEDLQYSIEEAKELLDDLRSKNQKLFLVNIIFVHFANSLEELNQDTILLKQIANKHICDLNVLHYQQEDGLTSALPLGLNTVFVSRALTTESTAVFIPFTSQELIQQDGMYYGVNAVSNNMIILNRKNLKNPNGFILGTSGSGKSFAAKREIVNVLLATDDDVIIIDPEREYASLAEGFDGEIIHISAGSTNYINPLDLNADYADQDDPLLLKSEFILSMCETIIGGRYGLSAAAKTILDRCVKRTYEKYLQSYNPKKFKTGYDPELQPTLLDYYKVIKEQPEPEARDLALELERYTEGNLSVFANKTNIDIHKRFVIFDTKDLGKQLKTMGMLIVLDAVWNRITTNRAIGKRTWFYVDEFYLLFNNEYSANFFFELYKRARKWGGIPTGITQNVEDLLQSDLARRMLSNVEFILMFNQATSDRMELARLLNISDTQLSYVTNSEPGEGLVFAGGSIIPFRDKFPNNTKLYAMMTTKVEEIIEIQKERKARKEGDTWIIN